MKKLTFSIIFSVLIFSNLLAQLPNNNMYVLKQLDTHPYYSAIWGYEANGREYAILGSVDGTAFFDVTDSATIREVDFLPTASVPTTSYGNTWREMKVYSHYAYMVSEASQSGIQIVDLQYLPDSIRYVGKFTFPGHSSTHSISQEGPYLYLNGANSGFVPNGGIAVVDLTNPEVPVLRGKWTGKYVHDCRVIDNVIYAMNIDDGYVSVINASNKDALTTVTQWINAPNPSPHNCDLTYDKKYLLATDEVGALPRLLKVWDIQDIQNPVQAATWQPTGITGSRVHNVETYAKYALVAHYTAGVRLVNISNPLQPVEVAWYDTYPVNNSDDYEGCWGVYMFQSGKIIASDISGGLFVLKTTFPISTDIEDNTVIPDKFALNQNYPNPFNPSTKINFSLPENSQVKLEVFNIAGQSVAELVNDTRKAGNYEVTFDAGKYGLTSGAYFYKLTAGGFSETKRMLLIK